MHTPYRGLRKSAQPPRLSPQDIRSVFLPVLHMTGADHRGFGVNHIPGDRLPFFLFFHRLPSFADSISIVRKGGIILFS